MCGVVVTSAMACIFFYSPPVLNLPWYIVSGSRCRRGVRLSDVLRVVALVVFFAETPFHRIRSRCCNYHFVDGFPLHNSNAAGLYRMAHVGRARRGRLCSLGLGPEAHLVSLPRIKNSYFGIVKSCSLAFIFKHWTF